MQSCLAQILVLPVVFICATPVILVLSFWGDYDYKANLKNHYGSLIDGWWKLLGSLPD